MNLRRLRRRACTIARRLWLHRLGSRTGWTCAEGFTYPLLWSSMRCSRRRLVCLRKWIGNLVHNYAGELFSGERTGCWLDATVHYRQRFRTQWARFAGPEVGNPRFSLRRVGIDAFVRDEASVGLPGTTT